MSRQPIGKGDRVTIILNPAFPKERVISEYFSKSVNRSADIKEILYNFVIGNKLSMNDKPIINDCIINDNSITKEYTLNDNSMINNLSKNDDKIINELPVNKSNSNNDFSINLDDIEDKVIKVEHSQEEEVEKANNNALNFLKGQFV